MIASSKKKVAGRGPHLFTGREDSTNAGPDVPLQPAWGTSDHTCSHFFFAGVAGGVSVAVASAKASSAVLSIASSWSCVTEPGDKAAT
jgi:hypothetical protein